MEQVKSVGVVAVQLVDYDGICQKIRAAIEPARAHAISLHDAAGDVLWLSEGSMGPDEHSAVIEAMDAFVKPEAAPVLAFDLGDSRSAMMVRVISARREMVGAVMLIMDSRVASRGPTKLMTPRLQRALSEFAVTRPDGGTVVATGSMPALLATGAHPQRAVAKTQQPPSIPTLSLEGDEVPLPRVAAPPAVAAKPQPAPAPRAHAPAMQSLGIAAGTSERLPRPVIPETERLNATPRKNPIALFVQRLVPLMKGSRHRRYEVLLRAEPDTEPKTAVDDAPGSLLDRRVVSELVGWLVRNPDVWQRDPVLFSVNLTATALHDDHFIKFVELCLTKSSLPKGIIGFEVDAPTALKLMDRISEVAAGLHRLGCPLVLDDFALRTECFTLLRLPGIRYVKLSPEITAKMRSDKLSQAAITGVVQMSRVLGMHVVAKRAETAAEQEWLTALGVDFVQSHKLSPPAPIESLGRSEAQQTA
jgi:EAL domain-containing protein (putative c-di-GMP-specific phosphodiesterase class I)